MKIKKSVLTLALVLVLMFSFAAGAAAAGTLQEISAYLNSGITIRYNGEVQTMKDASGNRVYPITYNGTTYLPVRAVSDMLGIGVDWDQATQTVSLGEKPDGTDLINTFKPYTAYNGFHTTNFYQTANNKYKSIGGINVDHWIAMESDTSNPEQEYICSFNLGGKYDTLTFQAYSDKDTTLTVKGDNDSVLAEFNLIGGQTPQTFTVNLLGTTQLTFVRAKGTIGSDKYDDYYRPVSAFIFDAILK